MYLYKTPNKHICSVLFLDMGKYISWTTKCRGFIYGEELGKLTTMGD